GGIELVPRQGLVEQLRAVKDEGELDTFRRACAITDRMFERLVSEVPFVGRRERDVAWDITRLYHEEGADEPAFEAIVGSGTASASTCTSGRDSRPRAPTRSRPATSSPSSRVSTSRAASGSGSRTT